VNVRVLFATHVDLRHAVNSGRFREDLYYRIAQYTVEIPPLRKRLSDMRFLVDDILASLGRSDVTVDEIGMALLLADDWRGNVRQLRNVLQRALVESDGNRLRLERVLGPGVATNEPGHPVVHYDAAKEEFDRHYYTSLHKRFAGNISKISKAAGKQRVTVRTALRAFGLED
jgi:DNA-binding NtrC family response regulator